MRNNQEDDLRKTLMKAWAECNNPDEPNLHEKTMMYFDLLKKYKQLIRISENELHIGRQEAAG